MKYDKTSFVLGVLIGVSGLLISIILARSFADAIGNADLSKLAFSDLLLLIQTLIFGPTLIGLIFQIRLQGKDLEESAKSRQVSALFEVFNNISTDQARKDRKYVYNNLPDAMEGLPENGWRIANRVWTSLDHVGLLVENGLVDEKLVMEMYCELIIKCWIKLRPHIEMLRVKQGGRYQKYFELLATRAEAYHRAKYPNEKIKFYSQN
jgi:hypothetical protein